MQSCPYFNQLFCFGALVNQISKHIFYTSLSNIVEYWQLKIDSPYQIPLVIMLHVTRPVIGQHLDHMSKWTNQRPGHIKLSDPYVTIYLHHQNNRSAKKKTHIKKRSLNPVFNESFIFDLPTKDGSLGDVQLEVTAPINIVKLKVLVKSKIRTTSNNI